jgi:methyl-accepting chemotaxis protein
MLDPFSLYLDEIRSFLDSYIIKPKIDLHSTSYFHLKSEILKELNKIIQELQNLNSNCSNINRLLKNGTSFLTDLITSSKNMLLKSNDIASNLINSLQETQKLYENNLHLWIELNKIKNISFKLNKIPDFLEKWDEIKELFVFVKSLNDVFIKKRKKNGQESLLTFQFDEISQYFLSKDDNKSDFYTDIIYLLHSNKLIEEYQGDEFINVLERKEIIQNIQDFIRPLLTSLILDKFYQIIFEIQDVDPEKGSELDPDKLKDEKISNFLPKIVDYYIMGLEKKFQEKIHDDTETEEFEKIANFYYQKIDEFYSNIQDIEDWLLTLENFLIPYNSITDSLRKIFTNLTAEISRRKNEYLTFIKTVKDEELRVNIRKYIKDKISELNDLIRTYEDETSLIIKEEFPQLKRIRDILNKYTSKIQSIKDEVYKTLDSQKSHDIDIYQIIKSWEENFNRKRQQLTFLISLMINKLFKSFKELLDKEGFLFATITEISEQTENFEELPLNFALSAFLAEKLTEEELRERIAEISSKINHLNNSLGLYQVEQSKLEKILTNKVKINKGISDSNVQCTVCHKYINFAKDKVITCSFCGSTYHYLCVAFWLSKYNSCPMCQNHFLEPHSDLFDGHEDQELEEF